MSFANYQPLSLKYRPQKLDDVLGQNSIKETLINAINNGKIVHAYLLTGPRGSGKTSTARILAKSLNCHNALDAKSPSTQPCGECASCVSIANSSSIDVVEIDAASHGGVDDARQIVEKVNLASVSGKYRIYIIDEVHMLSKDAFNALLKVIEEPPSNVVFVLATTEVDKVPKTIASRCQQLKFKPITVKDCCERLKYVANREKINITHSAIELIAEHSDGAMRDALSLLDQVGVFSDSTNSIGEEKVQEILGGVPIKELADMATAILRRDAKTLIALMDSSLQHGRDPIHIVDDLIDFLLQILETSNGLEVTNKYPKQVVELCKQLELTNFEIVQILDSLTELNTRFMTHSKKNKNLFRAWLIKICNRAEILVVKDLLDRVKDLEIKIQSGVVSNPRTSMSSSTKPLNIKEIIPVKTIAERPIQPASKVNSTTHVNNNKTSPSYDTFMDYLSPSTRGMCVSSSLQFLQVDAGVAKMQVPLKSKFLKSRLEAKSEEICSAIAKICGSDISSLDIEIVDEHLDIVSTPCVTRPDTKLDEVISAGVNIFGGKEI